MVIRKTLYRVYRIVCLTPVCIKNQGSRHIDISDSHSSFSGWKTWLIPLGRSKVFWSHHQRTNDEIIHWDHKVSGLHWLWGDSLIILLPRVTMTLGRFSTWITRKEFLNVLQLKKFIWNGNRRGSKKPKRPPSVALSLSFFLVKFWYWGSDNMICLCSPSLQHQSCWERQSNAAGSQRS